ncbi:MAG: acyl carrier protein phosphodiesterase [Bacteroidota bacterium]
MNFLAHLFLSGENEDLMIGNFIADFIRNKEVADYTPAVQKGIQLHRSIDSYTDQHPIVRQGTRRLQAHHHKYSPVVIDVLYDYLLAMNWSLYSDQSLKDFTQGIYAILNQRMDEMPFRLKKRLPNMIEHNWLMGYGTEAGLRLTFSKMDQRTAFPSNFSAAFDHLQQDYGAFEEEFNLFFPEVIVYVKDWLSDK